METTNYTEQVECSWCGETYDKCDTEETENGYICEHCKRGIESRA